MNLRAVLSLSVVSIVLVCGGCTAGKSEAVALDDAQLKMSRAHELVMSAQRAQHAGKMDEAIKTYAEALKLHRDYPAAWYNFGVLLQGQKKYAEAAEALQVAADLDLTDPRAYAALGFQAQELGWFDEALKYYSRALERNPNYLPALKKAVESGQLLDRYDDAMLERARRALLSETDPKWVEYLKRMQLKAQERVGRAGGSTGS